MLSPLFLLFCLLTLRLSPPSLHLWAALFGLVANAQRMPYISSTDDSRRVISTTLTGPDGHVGNTSAMLCATPPPPYGYRDRLTGLQQARSAEKRGLSKRDSGLEAMGLHGIEERAASEKIVVETYFHIVSTRDQSKWYTAKRRGQIVNNQAIALNTAYKQANISFHINPTTYHIRDDWATDASSTSMKKALRRGKYGALNIYFQSNLSSNPGGGPGSSTLLGYCTLPTPITYDYGGQTYQYPQSNWATDGCNVLAGSMPGSPVSVYGYDRGKTAVHEVGHWFGLLHTFQDNTCGSGSTGDYVDDTPQESTSTVGCPKGKDSCPTLPGLDPITNYMDYSDDQCYIGFTPDQMTRMRDLWTQLRKGK